MTPAGKASVSSTHVAYVLMASGQIFFILLKDFVKRFGCCLRAMVPAGERLMVKKGWIDEWSFAARSNALKEQQQGKGFGRMQPAERSVLMTPATSSEVGVKLCEMPQLTKDTT